MPELQECFSTNKLAIYRLFLVHYIFWCISPDTFIHRAIPPPSPLAHSFIHSFAHAPDLAWLYPCHVTPSLSPEQPKWLLRALQALLGPRHCGKREWLWFGPVINSQTTPLPLPLPRGMMSSEMFGTTGGAHLTPCSQWYGRWHPVLLDPCHQH